jgi:spore coat polysaccharide biosynthesis protein SpsF (cytidylyltransferase family)
VKLTDPVWIAPGSPAAVLAAPGYGGSWPAGPSPERIARAFIAAAGNAGADAVELDAHRYNQGIVAEARERSLRPVARAALAGDVFSAANAGVETFHAGLADLDDHALVRALADAATCIIISGVPGCDEALAIFADAGAQVIPLYSHNQLTKCRQAASGGACPRNDVVRGCDLAESAIPAIGGVLVAAFGVSLVRQHLAVERRTGPDGADRFLSQKDFRKMVQDIRAAERILARPEAAEPLPHGRALVAERTLPRGELIRRDHFEAAADVEGKIAKITVGKGHAVLVSELAATIALAIDFTAAPEMQREAVELLLTRTGRARTVDCTRAITTGHEAGGVCEALARFKTDTHQLDGSWLGGVLAIAARARADVVVRVPAQNVLTDPELLDRMVIQHVRSGADYTLCSDLPRGISPGVMSAAALRRISSFTGGAADAATVHKLLSNQKVFRVQETIVESSLRRPGLDLIWHSSKQGLFDRIVETGSESVSQLIARASSIRAASQRPSESEARGPLCTYSFLTTGGGLSSTM